MRRAESEREMGTRDKKQMCARRSSVKKERRRIKRSLIAMQEDNAETGRSKKGAEKKK